MKSVRIVQRAAMVGALLTAMPAAAQVPPPPPAASVAPAAITTATKPPKVRLIEWNLPAQADATPGAVVVDTQGHDKSRMWFVTRSGEPHLYRMEFPKSLMKGSARWTSWKLNALTTGGIKRLRASHDRRYIFVRTLSNTLGEAIERVDTDPSKCSGTNCETTVYEDGVFTGFDVSDVAVDDRNNVFTTHTPDLNPTLSYVQRLTPGINSAQVTRWLIPGSGAGLCGDTAAPIDESSNTPCISGIAVHPTNRNLIYFSEPTTNSVAELNIGSSPAAVRRWSLDALSAACVPSATVTCGRISGPRQLQIDRRGKVWVVTGTGNLVSLDPCNSRMTIHELPDNVTADPFGLAPDDDVIGYTSSRTNKVGMLLPKGRTYCVQPSKPVCVDKTTICQFPARTSPSVCNSNTIGPIGKTVAGQVTKKDDGTFIEAKIDTALDANGNPMSDPNPSLNPLGITPVKNKAQGTFFFTVGMNAALVDRVGFVRLPIRERITCKRDDDDEDDGWEGEHSWHDWHGHAEGDDDDDGVENQYDQRTTREDEQTGEPAPVAAAASVDYPLTASPTSLALIAMAKADDALAQIGVEIYDAAGLLVATSAPAPGVSVATLPLPAAGNYKVRVRNFNATGIVHTPTFIVREPWQP
jgi:hypothetical protein